MTTLDLRKSEQRKSPFRTREREDAAAPVPAIKEPTHPAGVPVAVFRIDPTRENLLDCPGGTQVRVPAYSMEFWPGQACEGCAQVRVKEVYTLSEAIRENLSTVTETGAILETSGMVLLQAEALGQELSIAENRPWEVRMSPRRTTLPGSQLFFGGGRDENGGLAWRQTPVDLMGPESGTATMERLETLLAELRESGRKEEYSLLRMRIGRLRRRRWMSNRPAAASDTRFQTRRMGWHNVDRFYRGAERSRSILIIKTEAPADTRLSLTFPGLRTTLQGGAPLSRFFGAPENQPAVLTAYYTEADHYRLSRRELTLQGSQNLTLTDFRPVSEEELKAQLPA